MNPYEVTHDNEVVVEYWIVNQSANPSRTQAEATARAMFRDGDVKYLRKSKAWHRIPWAVFEPSKTSASLSHSCHDYQKSKPKVTQCS